MMLGMVSTSLGTLTLYSHGWDKPALDIHFPMGPAYFPNYWNEALDKCAKTLDGEVTYRAELPKSGDEVK